MARSENLPVLPQAVSQVLRLADDPNSSARDLERVIERDPAITAKILKAANSAYYGGANVPTISRAITFLGMNAVRSLMVSLAFQQMIGGRSSAQRFCKIAYWRHCLGVATASRILGKIKIPQLAEELYCAGMLHDVGMLVLERFMPADFDAALEEMQAVGRYLHEVEEVAYGFDHSQVGGVLASRWGLEGVIRHAILYHHAPETDSEFFETTCIVAAANAIAHQAGLTNNAPGIPYDIPPDAAALINLPEEQYDVIRSVVATEVAKAQEALQIAA